MKNIKLKLYELSKKGFFEIIISSTIVKGLMFFSAIFLPRFLTVEDYGVLTYVETILSYVLMINGLGMTQATLKYCSVEKSEKTKKGIFQTTMGFGLLFDLAVMLLMLILLQVFPFKVPRAGHLLRLMLGIPLLAFVFQNMQFYLRANFENRKYSIISCFYTLLYVGSQIILAMTEGINGVVFARYISYILCIFFVLLMTKSIFGVKAVRPDQVLFKSIVSFSVTTLFGNFFSLAISNNEIFLVGNVFNDSNLLANYKVSSYVLQICIFFVDSIMVFCLPYFSRHANDKVWIWSKFSKLFVINFFCMSIVIVFLFVVSEPFVKILWGAKYIQAIPLMKVLLIAAFMQTVLRAIAGNILAFIGEERYTLRINMFLSVLHIVIDLVLFKVIGRAAIGYGLIITYALSGLFMILKIRKVCKRNVFEKNID